MKKVIAVAKEHYVDLGVMHVAHVVLHRRPLEWLGEDVALDIACVLEEAGLVVELTKC